MQVVRPEPRPQLLAGDDPTRALEEDRQDLKRLPLDGDDVAVPAQILSRKSRFKRAEADDRGSRINPIHDPNGRSLASSLRCRTGDTSPPAADSVGRPDSFSGLFNFLFPGWIAVHLQCTESSPFIDGSEASGPRDSSWRPRQAWALPGTDHWSPRDIARCLLRGSGKEENTMTRFALSKTRRCRETAARVADESHDSLVQYGTKRRPR